MSILTWLAGPYIDITPLDYPELYQEAACDKHRELVEAAQIEAMLRQIVAAGGGDVEAILVEVDARCADDAPMF